jgi:hypothetical protein
MRVAFDPDRRWLVSLGGYDGRSSVGVLRVFENGTWRTIADDPDKAGAESGFVYDSRRRRYVAFGGSSAPGQALGDTWIYSYGKWTKLTGESPPPRQAHVMVFDERRGRVVMFGGQGPSPIGTRPPRLGDLWELDGDRWTRRAAEGPSARGASGAAYDSKRGRTIVFGGVTADGFTGETWAWNGETWTKLADTGPEPRAMGYLAYDDVRDRVVLFGGRKGYPDGDLDDTWEFDGAAWHRVGS